MSGTVENSLLVSIQDSLMDFSKGSEMVDDAQTSFRELGRGIP